MAVFAKILAEFNPKGINDAENAFQRFSGVVAGALATGAIVNFGKAMVDAALQDEAAQRKLAVSLKNTTDATDAQVAATEDFITKTMMSTGVLDDNLRPALATLVRATEDTAQAQDLLGISIDASIGLGKDLETVSIAVAKAQNGNVSALGRLGIATKDAEGNTLSFDEVMKNMAATFGGQAAAAMDTAEGKMRLATIAFDEAKETIGAALLPTLSQLAEAVVPIIEAFSALPEPVRNTIVLTGIAGGAFASASKSLQGFGMAAKTANIALGVVGATLGAAVTIYSLYSSRKAEATQRTKDLAGALDLESDAQQTAIEELVANDKNTRRVIQTITDLGYTLGDLEQYYESGTGKLAKLVKVYDDFEISSADNLVQGKKYAEVLGLTEEQVEGLFGSYNQLTVSLDKTVSQSEKLRDEYLAQKEVASLVATATGDATIAQQDAADAALEDEEAQAELTAELEKQEAALRDLIAAQLAAFSSQIGYEEATFDTTDALHQFNLLVHDVMMGTYEGSDAFRDYAVAENAVYEAALDQAAAAAKLAEENAKASGGMLTAAQSAIIQRNELDAVARTLDPSSPLRRQLEEYVTTLNSRIPRELRTVLSVTSEMDIETRRAINLQKRASGGPVSASTPYLVGEQGPELFIPNMSGQVISNRDLAAASTRATNATSNNSIVINMPAGADGNDVVRALQRWVDNNGPVPIATTTARRG